jgi:hypothetical protein
MTIRVNYTGWLEAIRAVATEWNASFNGSNRMTRGVDTPEDMIVTETLKGVVLTSPDGHYWRGTVSNLGVVTWADLGTTKP